MNKRNGILFVVTGVIIVMPLGILIWSFLSSGLIPTGEGLQRNDWLSFWGGALGYIGTVLLGMIAVWQNFRLHDAQKENEQINAKLMRIEEMKYGSLIVMSDTDGDYYSDGNPVLVDPHGLLLPPEPNENNRRVFGLRFKNMSEHYVTKIDCKCFALYEGNMFLKDTRENIVATYNDREISFSEIRPQEEKTICIGFNAPSVPTICTMVLLLEVKNYYGVITKQSISATILVSEKMKRVKTMQFYHIDIEKEYPNIIELDINSVRFCGK